jgi:Na+/H+ antiporter NhaD/arsenite permease-like protein
MTPLVLDAVLRLNRNPVPYLLAIAMASNIGSVATITGNPQNMIVGSLSHISYTAFLVALAPIAAAGLALVFVLLALVYRTEFLTAERFDGEATPRRYHRPLVSKTILVVIVMIALFFLGQPVEKVAIVGGAFLLLTRRVNPRKIYREIDWPLLVMFGGLFVVIAGFEKAVVTPEIASLRRSPAPRKRSRARQRDRHPVELGQQCAGGACAQAVRAESVRSAACLVGDCDGIDFGG